MNQLAQRGQLHPVLYKAGRGSSASARVGG